MSQVSQRPVKLNFDEGGLDDVIQTMTVRGLGEALEEGLETAAEYAKFLVSTEESSGLALARFLHGINQHWVDFEKEEGDDFQRWAVRSTGRHAATIQRRVCVWEMLSNDWIPESHREQILSFSIKMLSKAYRVVLKHRRNNQFGNYDFVEAGYKIPDKLWLALSQCTDEIEVNRVVDEITGRQPNSNRISFKYDDKGQVWAFVGKQEGFAAFSLDWTDADPLVQRVNDEILERLGATEFGDY